MESIRYKRHLQALKLAKRAKVDIDNAFVFLALQDLFGFIGAFTLVLAVGNSGNNFGYSASQVWAASTTIYIALSVSRILALYFHAPVRRTK